MDWIWLSTAILAPHVFHTQALIWYMIRYVLACQLSLFMSFLLVCIALMWCVLHRGPMPPARQNSLCVHYGLLCIPHTPVVCSLSHAYEPLLCAAHHRSAISLMGTPFLRVACAWQAVTCFCTHMPPELCVQFGLLCVDTPPWAAV